MNKKNTYTDLLFYLLLTLPFLIPALIKPYTYPSDDAYFYLQVAENIAAKLGSTFNGITETNGYHPLWLIICIFPARAAKSDPMLLLRLIFILQSILFVGVMYFGRRIVKLEGLKYFGAVIPLLAVYFLAIGNLASEAHINAFMHILAVFYWFRYVKNGDFITWAIFGGIMGLLFMARLDNIFLIVLFSMYALSNSNKFDTVSVVSYVFAFCSLVFPYFIFNIFVYGALAPISGMIKSTFPWPVFDYNSIGTLGKLILAGNVISAAYVYLKKKKGTLPDIIKIFSLAAIVHAHYYVIFTDHLTNWPWYFVTGLLSISFFIILLLNDIKRIVPSKLKSLNNIIVSLAVLFYLLAVSRCWSEYFNPEARGFNPFQFENVNQCKWNLSAAEAIKNHVPEDEAIIIHDWPGMIAFFTDRKIVPIDGLMNDLNFQEDLVRNGIGGFIKENKIKYIIAPLDESRKSYLGYELLIDKHNRVLDVYSSLYQYKCGSIILYDEDIVFKFRDEVHCPGTPDFALWKIPN